MREEVTGRTTTTVRDNQVGGLLAYLGNNRLGDAATVVRSAADEGLIEELIAEKGENPLAACGAAYVGLATLLGRKDRPRWTRWLVNLANRYDWMPDGAIVQGAYLLQFAKDRADLDAALAAFKTAYRRGLPYYAAGVPQLLNGLFSFIEKDKEAKAMHEKVSRVALCVDPNQQFTVVTIRPPTTDV